MKRNQRGTILIAALLILIMGGTAMMLASGDLAAHARLRTQMRSANALAQAREALLGYAISYAEQHPGQAYGYLPCPDSANTGSASIGACAARDFAALGRFPYRTLGLSDLRDGTGDCLWYAVAGSVKNNPKARVLNWDSLGQFDVSDNAGRDLLDPSDRARRAAAIVFAPGPALATQTRQPASETRCPGSNNVAADLDAYLDGQYATATPGTLNVTRGLIDNPLNNDLLAWITIDDIFDAMRRRHDFPVLIEAIIVRASTALASVLNQPGFLEIHARDTAGNRARGKLPDANTLGIAPAHADLHDNWRDQMHFVACADASHCLHAELRDPATPGEPAVTEACRALLLFGGERIRSGAATQTRITAADLEAPEQYLEGINPVSLVSSAGSFSGANRFLISDPASPATEDVIKCIH